ncbi:MAG: hypothetical protein ABL967_13065 [Bryobacteraceae bacterium]
MRGIIGKRGRSALSPVWLIPALAAVLASCSPKTPEEPSLGVAYVGPAKLILRTDLTVRSPERITVSHGDRVDILETRRKFVRVRTEEGTQGWTDASTLLSAEQMDDLAKLGEAAKGFPSQGRASVFDQLNVHTEANRQSPSFFQIEEGGTVDVVGHRVTPRNQPVTRVTIPRPVSTKAVKRKGKGAKVESLLPPPPPPKAPENVQDLSRPRASDLPGYKAPGAPPLAPTDDWSLVRAPDGKVGWVLSRMLFMTVPDEVAQYAERQRITAFMALDEFSDDGESKPSWLWTTAAPGLRDAEFDSFRTFVWNVKRHRYETAHVERNLMGYYPVERFDVPGEKEKGFSLIVTDKDGQTTKRTYSFAGRRVKMISKTPFQRPQNMTPISTVKSASGERSQELPAPKWWERALTFVHLR